ncbi:unnamed protein product [Rhizoctonia solani]|uniref:Uncharacterized protein n=1 Tax=Rhizoctonia solani TaxID=456999 RepID=A0A8H3BTB9_9AGAM|nr:unnamed protein product [Rhizoctonia solani]
MRLLLRSVIIGAFVSHVVSGLSIPRAESTTCKLQLFQDSTPLQYVSFKLNEFGEYGILTKSTTKALEVTFIHRNNSQRMDMMVTGGYTDTPMLGGISGFFNEGEDLNLGSHHYTYVGLTAQTPSGSTPQTGANSFDTIKDYERKIESVIWLFDSATKQVTPQWINTDKSAPKNYLIYINKQNVIIITADKDKFVAKFREEFEMQGANPIEVTMKCLE